jgi:hypothetical protein
MRLPALARGAISRAMSANIRYWRSLERDALKDLDAAKTLSALKACARQLMLAREALLRLQATGDASAASE